MHTRKTPLMSAIDRSPEIEAVAGPDAAARDPTHGGLEEPLRVAPSAWVLDREADDCRAAEEVTVRITTLGPFMVQLPTPRGLRAAVWRDERTRALLKCLLAAPAYWLTREQVIEMLWPELDPARSQDALRHALSRLRRALEPDRAAYDRSPYIASDRETVWLVRHPENDAHLHLWVDRDHFEQLAHAALQRLERMPDTQQMQVGQQLAVQALRLYRDHFLPADLYVDWAQATRSRCRRLWVTLLWQLANVALMKRHFDQAHLLLGQLVEAMPDNERAVSQLMRVQAFCGQRGEALRAYHALATYLASEFGATPTLEVQRLANAIRAGSLPLDEIVRPAEGNIREI